MALKAGRVGVAPDQVDPYGNLKEGEHYVLPVASANTLGGVKIGNGLSIADGVLSSDAPTPYELPTASADTLGGIKVGAGLTITDGVLSSDNPTPYSLPTASADALGGVKIGSGLSITDGVLSVAGGSGIAISAIDNITFNFTFGSGSDPGSWLFLTGGVWAGGTQLPNNAKIVGFVLSGVPSEDSNHWNLVSLQPLYQADVGAQYRNKLFGTFYRTSGTSGNLSITVTGTVYYVTT